MTAIKKELHELIEVTTDERLLKAVHVFLASQSKVYEKPKTAKTNKAKMEKLVLPNGRTVLVTPGDPTVDTTELFGIWKDTPEIIETLRKTAWEAGHELSGICLKLMRKVFENGQFIAN